MLPRLVGLGVLVAIVSAILLLARVGDAVPRAPDSGQASDQAQPPAVIGISPGERHPRVAKGESGLGTIQLTFLSERQAPVAGVVAALVPAAVGADEASAKSFLASVETLRRAPVLTGAQVDRAARGYSAVLSFFRSLEMPRLQQLVAYSWVRETNDSGQAAWSGLPLGQYRWLPIEGDISVRVLPQHELLSGSVRNVTKSHAMVTRGPSGAISLSEDAMLRAFEVPTFVETGVSAVLDNPWLQSAAMVDIQLCVVGRSPSVDRPVKAWSEVARGQAGESGRFECRSLPGPGTYMLNALWLGESGGQREAGFLSKMFELKEGEMKDLGHLVVEGQEVVVTPQFRVLGSEEVVRSAGRLAMHITGYPPSASVDLSGRVVRTVDVANNEPIVLRGLPLGGCKIQAMRVKCLDGGLDYMGMAKSQGAIPSAATRVDWPIWFSRKYVGKVQLLGFAGAQVAVACRSLLAGQSQERDRVANTATQVNEDDCVISLSSRTEEVDVVVFVTGANGGFIVRRLVRLDPTSALVLVPVDVQRNDSATMRLVDREGVPIRNHRIMLALSRCDNATTWATTDADGVVNLGSYPTQYGLEVLSRAGHFYPIQHGVERQEIVIAPPK